MVNSKTINRVEKTHPLAWCGAGVSDSLFVLTKQLWFVDFDNAVLLTAEHLNVLLATQVFSLPEITRYSRGESSGVMFHCGSI